MPAVFIVTILFIETAPATPGTRPRFTIPGCLEYALMLGLWHRCTAVKHGNYSPLNIGDIASLISQSKPFEILNINTPNDVKHLKYIIKA